MMLYTTLVGMERRGPQFLTEPSYLVFPFPYSLAGIGQGVALTGLAGNIYDTNVDAYVLGLTGDVEGSVIAVEDIHLLPEFLILDLQRQSLSKAAFNNYETRGMNSGKDEFNLVETNKAVVDFAQLTFSLFDRRLELYSAYRSQNAEIVKISDSDGHLIADLDDPYILKTQEYHFGMLVDYTDDRNTPKKGVRFSIEQITKPNKAESDPEFYTIDKSITLYYPIKKQITWALHAFQSDAHVIQKGMIDPTAIRQELGMNCQPTDPVCLQAEQELVVRFISERRNGTATSLGGDQRLRSYPDGRFTGAHSQYIASEIRWNISEEVRPFNFGIWKDIATGFEVAFFYETGSVSETIEDLGKNSRSSYGSGFRLVSASGYIYRADYATGDEGEELTIIFSYPW